MRAVLQLLAAVITIAILWGLRVAVSSQGEQFTIGFGSGFCFLLVVMLLYRRFVGPIT